METHRLTICRVKRSLVWMLLMMTALWSAAPLQPALAQDLPVITAENAAALTTVEHWGYGTTRDVDWSADDQRMAVLTSAGVWIHDADGETPRLLPVSDHVFYSLDISADGRRVVAGSWDSGAHLWDAASGSEIPLPSTADVSTYGQWVKSVAISADGRRVAAGTYDGWAHVWTVSDSGEVSEPVSVQMGYDEIQGIAFSPDGSLVAGALRQYSASPVLWDVGTGQAWPMEGPNRDVTTVAFSPDGAHVVSGSYSGEVYVWDAASGALKTTLTGLRGFVTSASFSADGSSVAAVDLNGIAHWWSLESGETLSWPLVAETVPQSIKVAPAAGEPGAFHVALSQLDELMLWTVSPETEEAPAPQVDNGYNWTPWSLAVQPDGVHFAAGIRNTTGHIGAPVSNEIRLYQMGQADVLAEMPGHEQIITELAFSGDGERVFSGSQDNTVRFWSLPDGEQRESITASEQTLLTAALSPDERWIATGSFEETVRLWETASGQPVATLPAARVQAVGFSANSQRVIALNDDGALWQWNVTEVTGTTVPALTVALAERDWSDGMVNVVAFRPESEQVAVGFSDGSVEVWDVNSGARLAAFAPVTEWGFGNGVQALAWSPDGALLASGDTEGELRLWDVAAGGEIALLREHSDWINSVAFTPDGRQLLTASWDGLIRLWAVVS